MKPRWYMEEMCGEVGIAELCCEESMYYCSRIGGGQETASRRYRAR